MQSYPIDYGLDFRLALKPVQSASGPALAPASGANANWTELCLETERRVNILRYAAKPSLNVLRFGIGKTR